VADYRPDPDGGWLAALRADALLVLPAERAADVAALWPALGTTDAASAVIDRLTAGGVASAPHFALVVREPGSVRVVARGPLVVRVGADAVSGAGVSTWTERAFEGAPEIRVDAGRTTDVTAPVLPIVEGVVAASVIDWRGVDAVRAPATEPTAPPEGQVGRPDERTMVPDEDTVVGSRGRSARASRSPRATRPSSRRPVSPTDPCSATTTD
jgi:hypothetical protein